MTSALMLLARDPDLLAWRDRGVAIAMTPTQVILRVLVRKPYRWVPAFHDLVAMDWQTGTREQLAAKLQAVQAAEPT